MRLLRPLRLFILILLTTCAHTTDHGPGTRDQGPTTKKGEENPYYYLVRSNLEAFEGNLDASLEDLQKAIAVLPENAHLKYLAAERFAETQNLEKASQYIEEALRIRHKWYNAKLLKGQILEAKGEFAKATPIFEELVKEHPKKEEVYLGLAQNLVHREQYTQAIQVLNSWVAKNLDSQTTLFYIATIQNVYLKSPTQALSTYQKLLKQDPDNVKVRAQMAEVYLKQDKKEEALKEFQTIEQQYPNDLSIKLEISSLYQELGDIPKSISKLKEILRLNPLSDRIRYFLGLLYEKQGKQKRALHHFGKVSFTSGLYKDAILQTAVIYRDLKQPRMGIQILKEAIRRKPKISQFYQFLSLLWEEEEKMDLAVGVLKEGLRKIPSDEELYFNLGILYDKLKRREETLKMMRKVLEINPKNASALNYIGYTFAEAGENLDEAEKLILQALEIKPGDGYITDSLGWVYFQKGDLKKAFLYIQKALKIFPEEPVIVEHMGDIYLKMGQKPRALKFFKKAVALGKKKEKPNLEEIKRVEEKVQQLGG